ncbi:hypothetical protein [Limnovirga soli]|uniref:Lipoprotein n=1 Tax=Limnovirga soli TaxID=2656915 RepID=A0A8J8JTJ1_9BACT|nr:hypothetical protein [Limnovirga soli]NNV55998.1 hypothetical protein [Limnovirga soli]
MHYKQIFAIAAITALTACNNHAKKILVYANTGVQINQEAKTVVQKDTVGHVDKELIYPTSDKVSLTVTGISGNTSIEIAEDGYYIVNLKAKDTIIGGFQKYSKPEDANRLMTQETLQHNIDSLQQMVANTNINAQNRTFFILPNTAVKISANINAHVVGPYHRMTSIAKEGNEEPEVYRFYSINEVRETIEKLIKLTK